MFLKDLDALVEAQLAFSATCLPVRVLPLLQSVVAEPRGSCVDSAVLPRGATHSSEDQPGVGHTSVSGWNSGLSSPV